MSAPPDPVVQPVSLMNQLSAMASTNAASAVSAYSGPADWPVPMPRPVSAVHVLPKTGPYQRNPITMAATVATMIAIQFTCPSFNAPTRAGHRLEQGHKHPDPARVVVVRRAEASAQETLLGLRAQVQRGVGHEERSRDQEEVPGRKARAGEVQTETGVDGVTHEAIGAGADKLVIAVDLELEVVVTSERRDGPDRKCDAR